MNLRSYREPYEDGFPTRFVMDDGSVWREATRQELADASPDLQVLFSLSGEPKQAGEYANLRFPGNCPFLPGIAALRAVYVRAARSTPSTPESSKT